MFVKLIDSNKTLNDKILRGVNILADAVGSTLGPKGRTIIIKGKNFKPLITKDGVTCAKAIELEDPFENLGVQIIKQAAESTVAQAGDGTTTSIIIANAIFQKAQSYITAGDSSIDLKNGIDKAVELIVKEVEKHSKPISSIEQIVQIATISANGDKAIGELIGIAVDKIGKDGSITIQEGRTSETILDVSEGFSFDSGLIANAFITDERRGVMRYEDCLVMVTDKNISTIEEILPALELVSRAEKSFVIIAEQVEGQALAALIMNTLKGNIKVCAIKAPRYGEERRNILDDIALTTGAKFISRDSGINLKQIKLADLGTAQIVESSKFATTIVSSASGREDKIQERIDSLKHQIEITSDISACERIQDRVTRLSSGIAVIKVGGATEVEMIEKKHRVEDALEAVNAAQQEGIVSGGGCALVRASLALDNIEIENESQRHGVDIIRRAVKEPFMKIASNAGLSADVLLQNILNTPNDWNFGYDISKNEECNMMEKGIIDPFKVVRCSLQNAASAAGTLLSTSVAIVEV